MQPPVDTIEPSPQTTRLRPRLAVPAWAEAWSESRLPIVAASRAADVADVVFIVPMLAFFVVKQILLVYLTGPFFGHDEVDHFWYVQRIINGDGSGVVGNVELPPSMQPYQHYVADYPLNSEVIQPPFYHVVAAKIAETLPGGMLATLYELRFLSVVLGTLVVFLTWLIARRIFPNERWIAIATTAFVALQPQFSFEAAIVNHDILIILLVTFVCYLAFVGIESGFTWWLSLIIGLVCVAGMWTKVNFGLILPVVGIALLIAAWDELRHQAARAWRVAIARLVGNAILTIGLPLIAILPWFARNYGLYGDPTGAARLQEVSDYGLSASGWTEMIFSAPFWRGRLDDFWGNFGWREIPLDTRLDLVIYLVWAVAGIGCLALLVRTLIAFARDRSTVPFDGYQVRCLGLSILAALLMVFGVLYVGTLQFTQSRFAFPAMFAFGLLTVLGYGAWLPRRARWVIAPVLVVALLALNVIVMVTYFIPYFVGPGGGALIGAAQ